MAHFDLGPSTYGLCADVSCLPRHLPCRLPRHLPCQHHFSCNCHVSSYVIDHVNLHVNIAIHVIAKSTATSSSMSSMYDVAIESVTEIILFVMFIFVTENGLGLGFGGSETIYNVFKTSWIKESITKI